MGKKSFESYELQDAAVVKKEEEAFGSFICEI
jgi:hypothetical protein